MAIHIKELNVTLHIGDGTDKGKGRKKRANRKNDCCSEENQQRMLEGTVREVLRVLNEQKER